MKPIERDRRRGGRSRYRTASTDRASRPIDLPQQMVCWDMVFQAEVLEQPLRRRLPPHNRPPPRIPIRENGIIGTGMLYAVGMISQCLVAYPAGHRATVLIHHQEPNAVLF
jgi:hypothetical protein